MRAAPLALLLVSALSIAGDVMGDTEMRRSETLENRTASIVYPIECDAAANDVHVRISARVAAGQIAWTLVDPRGQPRLTGAGTAGRLEGDSGSLAPIEGRWTLEVGVQNFTGNFRVEATAR